MNFNLTPEQEAIQKRARQAPPELVELADLVTEMRPLKHYYEAGVPARRGIEW